MKDIENLLSHPEVVKQSEVNRACEELKKAIQQLIVNPNLSSLKALIEKAEKIDLTLYQEEERIELEEALKVAKEQLENPTSEQAIKEAMDRLEAAINNTKLIPSKSVLSELIDKVSGLNKEEYTE
ncbi:hypothetical protein GNF79_19705, partial [Clostridium perfringens]